MKIFRITLAVLMAVLVTIAWGGAALAFHEGGVATCDGCHTMHNSKGNAAMNTSRTKVNPPTDNSGVVIGSSVIGTANAYLLQGSTQSNTCLSCHSSNTAGSSYQVMTFPDPGAGSPPLQLTPGGDFGWVKKNYTWTQPRNGSSPADRHGHNVNAPAFGLNADGTLATAPGGTYSKNNLHCSSCHDPHGKYRLKEDGTFATSGIPTHASGSYGTLPDVHDAVGSFRLLAGNGYKPASYAAGPTFANDPPIAVVASTYNRSEASSDTVTAYGKGMGEWCANCHGVFHNSTNNISTNVRHPAGNGATLGTALAANYNSYLKTGDVSGTNAYSSLVPVELQETNLTTLKGYVDNVATLTVTSTSNVMCLTCHRAHASGFQQISRWNNNTEFLTVDGDYADASLAYDVANEKTYRNFADGKSKTEYTQAMYGRPGTTFATFQRSLCNKCHVKD